MKKLFAAIAALIMTVTLAFSVGVSSADATPVQQRSNTCYGTTVLHEARYKKTTEETKTQWHYVKYTRTKTQDKNGKWSEYGPWVQWTPITHESWEDTNVQALGQPEFHAQGTYSDGTKWYRQWQARNTGETRQVKTGTATVYYLPGGGESKTLGEANWTTDSPKAPWELIDRRDREVKTEVACPPESKKIVRTFQVDTYSNPTTKLAKKAQGYDNDNKLKFGEDKAHYGHSRWQIVKVTGSSDWTAAQWRAAINKATTKAGVGTLTSQSHVGKVKKGQKLTVAWEILPGSWKDSKGGKPQKFFARGLK